MAQYLTHVNTVLGLMRESSVSALSTDADNIAFKVQEAVQRAVRRIWNGAQWSFKRGKDTLTTVSGTSEYSLPRHIGQPYIVKSSDTPYILQGVGEELFDEFIPNPVSTANPRMYMLFEVTGVENQPTSPGTPVVALSSSSADITQTVTVKGLVNGVIDYEEMTLTGTTGATTSKTFTKILSVTKNAVTAGRISLFTNSRTVTNGILARQELTMRVRKIRLYPEPTSALTITLKHFRATPLLTYATEDTEIPYTWDYVVNQYAFAFALMYKGKEQLEESRTQYAIAESMLTEMRGEEAYSADEAIVFRRFDEAEYNLWNRPPDGWGYLSYY